MHTADYSLFSRPCLARAHTTLTLINGGYVCTLTSASELRALEISPGVASLFSGVDRMVIRNRARLGLLPKLSTSAAPALAAFCCLLSLLFPRRAGKPVTQQRPGVLWKPQMCQYQSTNGSHVFAEWKKPGILRPQTCLPVNGSKTEAFFFFSVLFSS